MARTSEPPVVLAKGYDPSKWLLAHVESFPKSQRNAIGQRLTDRALGVMETLIEASYNPAGRHKVELLARANRELEVLRWLLRLADERELFTARQCRFASLALEECGRMLGDLARAGVRPQGSRTSARRPRLPMRRHKHLYARVASFENLLAVAREALRGKRGRAPGAQCPARGHLALRRVRAASGVVVRAKPRARRGE